MAHDLIGSDDVKRRFDETLQVTLQVHAPTGTAAPSSGSQIQIALKVKVFQKIFHSCIPHRLVVCVLIKEKGNG
jgi:hypothetical protein